MAITEFITEIVRDRMKPYIRIVRYLNCTKNLFSHYEAPSSFEVLATVNHTGTASSIRHSQTVHPDYLAA